MSAPFHIMIKPGDALAEVDRALAALQSRGVSNDDAGFHKYMFVTQAKQTVLMVTTRQAPLAAELRGKPGWTEPGDVPLQT
ncbi:MAG TPA: hypothetical protein VF665_08100 [Longimicrobium sp.]|jgi:hypothetical protein|uniref:hypothetical protein n=1 Tax=Longimicrobium sp. TaxID=2029185 RepID=UPI002ED8536D